MLPSFLTHGKCFTTTLTYWLIHRIITMLLLFSVWQQSVNEIKGKMFNIPYFLLKKKVFYLKCLHEKTITYNTLEKESTTKERNYLYIISNTEKK